MPIERLLDAIPLWGMFVIVLVLVLGSVEFGFRLGSGRVRKHEGARQASSGTLVAATMGLLAFMLAFTFGQGWSRFDTRRLLVIGEANAIRAAFLRTDLLSEPQRTESRTLLREYVGGRVSGLSEGRLAATLARSQQIHQRLWDIAAAAAKQQVGPSAGMFAQSVSEIITLHFKRERAGLHSRIPTAVLGALLFLATLAMASMGYHVGLAAERTPFVMFSLAFAFSAVMFLICDLDRSREGSLRVSQQALIELGRTIGAPEQITE